MQLRHKEAATQRKALHWAQELFSLLKTQTNKEIQPRYIKSYLDTACNSFKQVFGTVIRFCFMKCWVPLFHRIEECFLRRACCESRRLPRVTEQPAAGGELLCYWTLDGGRKQKKHFMSHSKHQSLHKKNVSLRNTDDKTPGGCAARLLSRTKQRWAQIPIVEWVGWRERSYSWAQKRIWVSWWLWLRNIAKAKQFYNLTL